MDYATMASALKDHLKWIVASLTAASALIFSGLSLASINLLAAVDALWWVPLLLSSTAVAASAVAIALASWTMATPSVSKSEIFQDTNPELAKQFNRDLLARVESLNPPSLAIHGGVQSLAIALNEASETLTRFEGFRNGTIERERDIADQRAVVRQLQQDMGEVLECGAFARLRQRYQLTLRGMAALTTFVVLATLASGFVTSFLARDAADETAKKAADLAAKPVTSSFTDPQVVRVYFTDAEALKLALTGHDCAGVEGDSLRAIAIGGNVEQPTLVIGPLTQGSGTDCATPWVWRPERAGLAIAIPEE